MGFGGIIAAGMAGGAKAAGEIADTQIAENSKLNLMDYQQQLEMEKMRAAEELRQSGILAENSGVIGAARAEQAGRVHATTAAVDTAEMANRVPIEARRAGEVSRAQGAAELDTSAAYADNKAAQAGDRAKALSRYIVGPEQSAQAELHRYQLGRIKAVDSLRESAAQARASGDEERAKALEAQAATLIGTPPGKSLADVAAVMNHLRQQAADEERPLNDPATAAQMSEEEKKQRRANIAQAREAAAALGAEIANRRGVPSPGKPAPAPAAPAGPVGPPPKVDLNKFNAKPKKTPEEAAADDAELEARQRSIGQ
jgi:hypothetical protein